MKKVIIYLLLLLVISGCKTQRKPNVNNDKSATQDLTRLKFCTELHPKLKENGRPTAKAGALKSRLWWNDPRFHLGLTVRFLNGTDFQKNKVMQYAKEWNLASAKGRGSDHKIQMNFIPFDVTTSGNVSDIRILFQVGGSSSAIGTDAKTYSQDEPTMFFGWINENQSEEALREVILHEFGHALGLIHEHQSPVANIHWDKEKVYQYYHDTQNPPWDRQTVDEQIFSHYDEESTNHTSYDPTSIMHYAIPKELTIDGFSVPWNTVLSPTDLTFIKEIYEYRPCIVGVDCCFDKKTGREIRCL